MERNQKSERDERRFRGLSNKVRGGNGVIYKQVEAESSNNFGFSSSYF